MALHPRVRAAVDAIGLPYEELDCDPSFADTEAFCARYGYPPERSANAILVAGKTDPRRYAVAVLLATTRLDVNRTVRKEMGVKKASFADAEEAAAVTGMALGGVTPFALPDRVPVFVDPRVMEPDWVILGGGNRESKLRIEPAALLRLPHAAVVPDLAVAIGGGTDG